MRSAVAFLVCIPLVTAHGQPLSEHLFSNPISDNGGFKIPSVHESTVQARRILQLQSIATLSTIFPPVGSLEKRPDGVATMPIGLMEYYALCGPELHNPTILGVTIATTMKNAAAGSNVTLSMRYRVPDWPPPPPPPDPWAYLPVNLPRFSLIGHIKRLSDQDASKHHIRECFLKTHPEAATWAPGSEVHDSWWGRLVVEEVYFVGGFGDRARIGWIPVELWRNISQSEIDSYRLVGEEGYGRNSQVEEDSAQQSLRVDL